ncbi:MAG: alpha/beta fold hydrolase [Clostridia bacterium]|nr:alpha/beta fold hydrolase [Clostridia bacterium]
MKKIFALFLALMMVLALLPAMSLATTEQGVETPDETSNFEVTNLDTMEVAVMSTTDMHGRSTMLDAATGNSVNNTMTKIATLVKQVRSEYDNTILIDNGDTIQGTLVATYWITKETDKLNPMIKAMLDMDYDVWNMGNHEFNYTPEQRDTQVAFAEEGGIDVLSANLVLLTEGENFANETVAAGEPYYKPYTIKTFTDEAGNEAKIAIIGLGNAKNAQWDVSSNYPNMQFSSLENPTGDIVYETNKWVSYVEAHEEPDIVIVAAHSGRGDTYADGGFNLESQATRIITGTTGVDLVIAGHDHSTFSGTFKNLDGEDVYLVNGGGNALTKTVFKITFDEAGEVAYFSVENQNLATSGNIAHDEELSAVMEEYYTPVEEWVTTPLGEIAGEWTHSQNANDHVLYQTETLDLVHKAQIWASWLSYESDGVEGATVSIASPVFRNFSTDPREVNMRDMISLYRYENTLYMVDMTGTQIKAWLNTLANNFEINASGDIVKKSSANIFGMDSVYGIDYVLDISKPEGQRLMYCTYNGEPLADETVIRVTLNNYRLSGAYGWFETVGIDDTDAVWSAAYYLGADRSQVKILLGEYFSYMGTVTADDEPYKGVDSEWVMVNGGIYGDVDGNGEIEAQDAAKILRITVRLEEASALQKLYGDVDGNGELGASDAAAILRYLVRLIDEFPADKKFTTETITYESSERGVDITAVVTLPTYQTDYPLVILAHGHGGGKDENIGFPAIAEALARQGIASIRMDFSGCGASVEDFALNTQSNMKDDIMDGLWYMLENYDVDASNVGIFGYSMGGRLALELIDERAYDFAAAVFLAPAADLEDLKNLFGGAEAWEELKAQANAAEEGYVTFTTIYGQTQHLSKEWFADLERYPAATLIDAAAADFDNPSLVIYAVDDAAVSPSVSQAVAAAFESDIIETPRDGHGYGFYSADMEILGMVADGAADFFKEKLVRDVKSLEYVVYIENVDGDYESLIPATVCVPVTDEKVPAVVMMHGTASTRDEAGNGYLMAAPVLAEEYGIATIRFDFVGNGESTGDYIDYNFTTAQSDAMACVEYMQELTFVDAERIGAMGWSQGGTIAMLLAKNNPDVIDSVVTWAGAVTMLIPGFFTMEDYAEAQENGFFIMEFDWREPLRVSLQWCEDVLNTDILAAVADYSGPILAIAGTADVTVDPVYAEQIADASPNEESKSYYIEGMDHTFNVFTGDLTALYNAIDATGAFFAEMLK